MKQLFNYLSKIAIIDLMIMAVAILVGLPAAWVAVGCLLMLDFATILWLGKGSVPKRGKPRRLVPLGLLCGVKVA